MRVISFGLVGAVSAAVHFSVAIVLVTLAGLPAMAGNLGGYLVALAVSWFGQSRLTFRAVARTARAPLWFVLTSFTGLVLNVTAYAALLHFTMLDYRLCLLVVLISVALFTWLVFDLWVFAGEPAHPA